MVQIQSKLVSELVAMVLIFKKRSINVQFQACVLNENFVVTPHGAAIPIAFAIGRLGDEDPEEVLKTAISLVETLTNEEGEEVIELSRIKNNRMLGVITK